MKQLALGLVIETLVPAAVGCGLSAYAMVRVVRGVWRDAVSLGRWVLRST